VLLSDCGARLWRVRQSAATALTDILAGRRWQQLNRHMEQVGPPGGGGGGRAGMFHAERCCNLPIQVFFHNDVPPRSTAASKATSLPVTNPLLYSLTTELVPNTVNVTVV
jgi:hypothetical protein